MRFYGRLILLALTIPLAPVVASGAMPDVMRAAAAALVLVLLIVAAWLPKPVDQAETLGYTPAPIDETILMHHAEQLCPVPASARPPVDRMLAGLPQRSAVAELEHDTDVDPVEVGLFTLADQFDRYGDRMDATLNRFAELLAGRHAEIVQRVDGLGERIDTIGLAAADEVAAIHARIDALEGRAGRQLADDTERWLTNRNDEGER